jgi:hypothetical protein
VPGPLDEPVGSPDDWETRTRTAADDVEKLPAASCCVAVMLRVPPSSVDPAVEQDHRPEAGTSVRHTGARSTYTVRTALGSPVPDTVVGWDPIRSPVAGAVMRGAAGAVRSSVIVTGAEAALRRSDRYPAAVLAVCVAVTTGRASPPAPGVAPPSEIVHRPSRSTVAVRSVVEPDTERITVAPAYPVPDTGPLVGREVVTAGGTMTSDAGADADPTSAVVRSWTVKTCCGPDRTAATHDHEPSSRTVAGHPAEPVATGPVTRRA